MMVSVQFPLFAHGLEAQLSEMERNHILILGQHYQEQKLQFNRPFLDQCLFAKQNNNVSAFYLKITMVLCIKKRCFFQIYVDYALVRIIMLKFVVNRNLPSEKLVSYLCVVSNHKDLAL